MIERVYNILSISYFISHILAFFEFKKFEEENDYH